MWLNHEREQELLENWERYENTVDAPSAYVCQKKLVYALEQLEQAREALDAIRLHPAVCNSFRGRQIVELADKALKQQEVG